MSEVKFENTVPQEKNLKRLKLGVKFFFEKFWFRNITLLAGNWVYKNKIKGKWSVQCFVDMCDCVFIDMYPLDCTEIQPVHSEGDQPGISLEGMMLKLKLQYFGHLMQSWLIGKDSDAGRDWGQDEKGTTEDEMAGWHHWLDGHESQWTPGVGDGQGGLVCCDSWGHKESDTTERLIWSDLILLGQLCSSALNPALTVPDWNMMIRSENFFTPFSIFGFPFSLLSIWSSFSLKVPSVFPVLLIWK